MDSPGSRWYLIAGLLICLLLASGCTSSKGASPLTNTTPAAPAAGTAISCAEGQTVCSGICRSTAADSSNCGVCGKVCGSGQYCSVGACVGASATVPVTASAPKTSAPVTTTGSLVLVTGLAPVAVTCSGGTTSCYGTCADLNADINNCGTCGKKCTGASSICSSGICCPSDMANCGGTCVDIYGDKNNCGACGIICKTGEICNPGYGGGKCMAGPCSGIDLNTDKNNCGTCGNKCEGLYTCKSGVCCDPDMISCGGICVDPWYGKNNCGSCGHVCPVGENCYAGVCTPIPMTTVAVAPHIPF